MGGLARRTQDVGDVLDAAGKDVIIYETVGVGQTELDIAEAADTTVVVLVPESGDAIQTCGKQIRSRRGGTHKN